MERTYVTLTGEAIDLDDLTADEKKFLGEVVKSYGSGEAYPNFVNRVNAPGSPALGGGQWVTKEVVASPLYHICQDLSDRIGIAQGYLAQGRKSSLYGTGFVDRDYISCEDASMLTGLSAEAIRKAIRENRLPARKVAHVYLIERQTVEAYAGRSKRAQAASKASKGKPVLQAKKLGRASRPPVKT